MQSARVALEGTVGSMPSGPTSVGAGRPLRGRRGEVPPVLTDLLAKVSGSPHLSPAWTRFGRSVHGPWGFGASSRILLRTPMQGHSALCSWTQAQSRGGKKGGGSCEPLRVSRPSLAPGGRRLRSRGACSTLHQAAHGGRHSRADVEDMNAPLATLSQQQDPEAHPGRRGHGTTGLACMALGRGPVMCSGKFPVLGTVSE